VGVCSFKLWKLIGRLGDQPDFRDFQVTKRVGDYMNPLIDTWWQIDDKTSITELEKLKHMIINILDNKILPELIQLLDDESLEKYWKEGNYGGSTVWSWYKDLIALMKINNSSDIETVIDEFAKYAGTIRRSSEVKEYLNEIGIIL
jgi:hypothetical protein